MYVVVIVALLSLASDAESSGSVYPYKSQDWLRYQLPSLWPTGGEPLLLLTGPSTARENLLLEDFAEAFDDHRVFQGGLSLGTLGDVMASLAYVEQAFGGAALPHILVLGVSPRFMAEIPEQRPLAQGFETYSNRFRVPGGVPTGFELEPKSPLEGAAARVRFLVTQQTPRYQAVVVWGLAQLLESGAGSWLIDSRPARWLLSSRLGTRLLPPGAIRQGPAAHLRQLVSPYKYRGAERLDDATLAGWLDDPTSWWRDVYQWDPARDSAAVRDRVLSLFAFAERHGIDLYVVNLPERSLSRQRYADGFNERFHRFLAASFDPLPVLDLRCMLPDEQFHDAEHARFAGARKITERTLEFVEDLRYNDAALDRRHVGELAERWSDYGCVDAPLVIS